MLLLHRMVTLLLAHPYAQAWHEVPEQVRQAVEYTESKGQWDAVSSAGCIGVMQICPRWSRIPKSLLYVPVLNRLEGAKHLHYWYRKARGNWAFALAAYNCGWGGLQGSCGRGYAHVVLRRAQGDDGRKGYTTAQTATRNRTEL